MIGVTAAAAGAVGELVGEIGRLDAAAAAGGVGALSDRLGELGVKAEGTARALSSVGDQTSSLSRRFTGLNGKIGTLLGALVALDTELDKKKDALDKVGATAAVMAAGLGVLSAGTTASAAAASGANNSIRIWGTGIRLTTQALHWLVMGTLEVAATAIPALIAFGSAAAGMAPTVIHISDVMNNLLVASGGLGNALLNSVGPLHALGQSFGTLSRAMAPEVYMIFGSIITSISSHLSAFSQVAEQAGNVMARFASHLSTELGPGGALGGQLTKMLSGGVHFMTQWGQLLGNLGHTFVNVAHNMWGAGTALLNVLVVISHVLEMLTANPVIGFLIGMAAALSAAYRYGLLLVGMFRALIGMQLVSAIRGIVTGLSYMSQGLGTALSYSGPLGASLYKLGTFLMTPLGVMAAAAAVVIGADLVVAMTRGADASDALIKKVQSMTPSLGNMTSGVKLLLGGVKNLAPQLNAATRAATGAAGSFGRFGNVLAGNKVAGLTSDMSRLSQAIGTQAMALVNLEIGYAQMGLRAGQVGAGMDALSLATAVQDSKVQQLNQAIDQYIGLLTGGTGALAAFSESMQNIGQVAANVRNNLGKATGQMSLSVGQFATALQSFKGTGAAAWNNFDQVVGSTMPQMLDWFRTAGVLGASTGRDVTHAALDMAKALVPLAAKSKTAQATLLGVLRSAGLNIPSFNRLKQMVAQAGVGFGDLSKRVSNTTIAMSNLSQMAKNVASALSQQVSTQLANAALASTGFNTKLAKLQTDAANGAPWATIRGDLQTVQDAINTAGLRGIAWGNQMAQGSSHASTSVQSAGHSMTSAFSSAQASAERLQAFIDSMHGKNIIVTVTQQGNVPGVGGGGGGPSGAPGGVHGPNPGIVRLGGGGASQVVVHVHGSLMAEQEMIRVAQAGLNRKTIRNGSTQLFISGRVH